MLSTAISTTSTAISTTSTAVSTITGVTVHFAVGAVIAIVCLISLFVVKELLNSTRMEEKKVISKVLSIPAIVLFAIFVLTVLYKALLVI